MKRSLKSSELGAGDSRKTPRPDSIVLKNTTKTNSSDDHSIEQNESISRDDQSSRNSICLQIGRLLSPPQSPPHDVVINPHLDFKSGAIYLDNKYQIGLHTSREIKTETSENQNNCFFVGEHSIKLKKFNKEPKAIGTYDGIEKLASKLIKRVHVLEVSKIAANSIPVTRKEQLRSKKVALPSWTRFCIHLECTPSTRIAAFYLLRVDTSCKLTLKLIDLLNAGLVQLELNSIDFTTTSELKLSVRVYLDGLLNKTKEIHSDPTMKTHMDADCTSKKSLISLFFQFRLIKFDYSSDLDDIKQHSDQEDEDDIINQKSMEDSQSERLFESAYERRSKMKMNQATTIKSVFGLSKKATVQAQSGMRTCMKPYQVEAVKWMLEQENSLNVYDHNDGHIYHQLHPLYLVVTNSIEQTIYLHKFLPVYSVEMPLKKKPIPGGILAEHMGLGKTLEMLALMCINRRTNRESACRKNVRLRGGSQVGGVKTQMDMIKCHTCGKLVAVKSIHQASAPPTTGTESTRYICESCLARPVIESACTLVVVPASICSQWIDEIHKHTSSATQLKVDVYKGVTDTKNFRPFDLASLDVCITTYEVLAAEVAYAPPEPADAPDSRQSKYLEFHQLNIPPSPLLCIHWWRLCLDEAHLLKSTPQFAECVPFLNRIAATNRWCITSSPITRSLADLHTLFMLIRHDPYQHAQWFMNELTLFRLGFQDTFLDIITYFLWRTPMRLISDQISIPELTDRIVWLEFSPFESHFYENLLEKFRKKRAHGSNELFSSSRRTSQDSNDNLVGFDDHERLDQLDYYTIERVMKPIEDLRFACNHPQLILQSASPKTTSSLEDFKPSTTITQPFSIPTSIKLLVEKTLSDCETRFYECIAYMNAQACLRIIEGDSDFAMCLYQNVLNASEVEYGGRIRLDAFQKVHTLHNFIELLRHRCHNLHLDFHTSERIENMSMQMRQCEEEFLKGFEEKTTSSAAKFSEIEDLVKKSFTKQNKEKYLAAMVFMLDKLKASDKSGNIWRVKFGSQFCQVQVLKSPSSSKSNKQSTPSDTCYLILGNYVRSFDELRDVLLVEYHSFIEARQMFVWQLRELFALMNHEDDKEREHARAEMIKRVVDCHMEKLNSSFSENNNDTTKESQVNELMLCELCRCERTLKDYVGWLFDMKDDSVKSETNDIDLKKLVLKGRSDLEKLARILISYSKQYASDDTQLTSVLDEFGQLFSSLKDEFKWARSYWLSLANLITISNELRMCRSRAPFVLVNNNQHDDDPSEQNESKMKPRRISVVDCCSSPLKQPVNLISRKEIPSIWVSNARRLKECKHALDEAYHNLLFLENTLKSYEINEGQENKEPCSICHENLGYQWFILKCGHLYCLKCHANLRHCNSDTRCFGLAQDDNFAVCNVCRHVCENNRCYVVSTRPKSTLADSASNNELTRDLSRVKLKDQNNSAKVEGVVKSIIRTLEIDASSKCLIFSEQTTMLEIIADSLRANSIEHRLVLNHESLPTGVENFRKTPSLSVLLMPYIYGTNGLSIVEAAHVFLVEPVINRRLELEAIGRVRRVGQTKPIFVYRFIIKNSIEQMIHEMIESKSYYQKNIPNASSINENNSSHFGLCISHLKQIFSNL